MLRLVAEITTVAVSPGMVWCSGWVIYSDLQCLVDKEFGHYQGRLVLKWLVVLFSLLL